MEEILRAKLKLLEKEVHRTKDLSIGLGATVIKLQYHLKQIPWWKFAVVLAFYWLVKLYLKTGWESFASFGVALAVSANLILVIPRISNNPKTNPIVPLKNDKKDMVVNTVQILNEDIKKNKIKIPPKIDIDKIHAQEIYKPIKVILVTGDVISGLLLAESDSVLTIRVTNQNGETIQRINKEIVESRE
jgi:hypothetical protein